MGDHIEVWTTGIIIVVFLILFILGPVLGKIIFFPDYGHETNNRLYLLSAIAQGLAAILALVVTVSLISVQLASQTFTPRVMRMKLQDPFFWGLIISYLASILWAIWEMSYLNYLITQSVYDRQIMDTGLLLTSASLLFLGPYIYNSINGLKPRVFAVKLLKKKQLLAVEEVLHRAVTEGFLTIINEIALQVDDFTIQELKNVKESKRTEISRKIADCYINVARRALRHNEQDAFLILIRHLSKLTKNCTSLLLRTEADIFNETVAELYEFSKEMRTK
jgi:hypothetical protein